MKTAVVIPARYGSSRFPGKALALLRGKTIVQWVWEQAMASKADLVLVATDDQRIFDAVEAFGGKAVMTSPDHPSGSDRIMEAVKDIDVDVIVNVQGDEPSTPPALIDGLIDMMLTDDAPDMGTVIVPCDRADVENNPNKPKVVISEDGYALYFSRAMIPFLREGGTEMQVYRHWGIYAYQRAALEKFVSLPESALEKCEKLEQLRALENGMRIKTIKMNYNGVDVNTPEDLAEAEALFASRGL